MGNRISWSEDLIEARLADYIDCLGRMPNSSEVRKLDKKLGDAITRYGGFRHWATRLGRSDDLRSAWSTGAVEQRLLPHVEELGRMPTADELTEREGDHRLSNAVARYGGYRHWAAVFDVQMKDSTVSRGQSWEDHEEELFCSLGWEVQRQSSKAEFDLLVNGHRVDVKSAKWSEYQTKIEVVNKSASHWVRGYIFGSLRRGAGCDFFDLLCTQDGDVTHRFLIPSRHARVTMLTITKRQLDGYGKYSQFKDRIDLLAPGCAA